MLDAILEARVSPGLHIKSFVLSICDGIFLFIPALSICSPSVLHWISNYSLIRSTSCSCSTCPFGFGISPSKNLQDFINIYRALIKDIVLSPCHAGDPAERHPEPGGKAAS